MKQLWCISLYMHSHTYKTLHVLFSITAEISQLWVSAVKVLTMSVMEETDEVVSNFAISFDDNLAALQGSESNKATKVKATNPC